MSFSNGLGELGLGEMGLGEMGGHPGICHFPAAVLTFYSRDERMMWKKL